jgi:catechol 2,3-dioxygenase-like lactoylglutathione lyase family enzyme
VGKEEKRMIIGIDHVQITVPANAVEDARVFYCGLLGLREIEKPESLRARGGFWLQVGDRQVHVGIEEGVARQATKAHVAYGVTGSVHGVRGSRLPACRFSMASPSPGAIASSSAIRSATASS